MFNNCGTWRKSLDISDSEVAIIFNEAFKKSCIPEELTIERTARQIRCTFDDGSSVWGIAIVKEDETTRSAYDGIIHNDGVVPADTREVSTADAVEFALGVTRTEYLVPAGTLMSDVIKSVVTGDFSEVSRQTGGI